MRFVWSELHRLLSRQASNRLQVFEKISFALRHVEVGLGEPKRCLLKEALNRLHGSMPLRFDPTLLFIILKGLSQGGPQRSMT